MDVWAALAVAITHAYSPQVIVLGGGVHGPREGHSAGAPGAAEPQRVDSRRSGHHQSLRPRIIGSAPCRDPIAAGDRPRVKSRFNLRPLPHRSRLRFGCRLLRRLGKNRRGAAASSASHRRRSLSRMRHRSHRDVARIRPQTRAHHPQRGGSPPGGDDREHDLLNAWHRSRLRLHASLGRWMTSSARKARVCCAAEFTLHRPGTRHRHRRIHHRRPTPRASSTPTSPAGRYRPASAHIVPATSESTIAMPRPASSIAAIFFHRLACRGSPEANTAAEDRLPSRYPPSR